MAHKGLSPRVRGNRTRTPGARVRRVYPRVYGGTSVTSCIPGNSRPGSIPACTGEPQSPMSSWSARWGLSPRVRGNPALTYVPFGSQGSIPACTGEPTFPALRAPLLTGSIPACTGEPEAPLAGARRTRSIPACTGEPDAGHSALLPHCTGEPRSLVPFALAGLSPRVRGNRFLAPHSFAGMGSIPACTGEPRSPGYAVHTPVTGLSPRVRGNRNRQGRGGSSRRGSIPACTGEPSAEVLRVFARPGSIPACTGEPSRDLTLVP